VKTRISIQLPSRGYVCLGNLCSPARALGSSRASWLLQKQMPAGVCACFTAAFITTPHAWPRSKTRGEVGHSRHPINAVESGAQERREVW
jgi:hypothetical protein